MLTWLNSLDRNEALVVDGSYSNAVQSILFLQTTLVMRAWFTALRLPGLPGWLALCGKCVCAIETVSTATLVGDGGVPWTVRTLIPPCVVGEVGQVLLTTPGGTTGVQFSTK